MAKGNSPDTQKHDNTPPSKKKGRRLSQEEKRGKTNKMKRASPASLMTPLVETEATVEALPAVISNWDGSLLHAGGENSTFMNGYTNTTTTGSSSSHSFPANSFHDDSLGSFRFNYASDDPLANTVSSGHNSEPFSLGCSNDGVLTSSEASSILERHIASHPIRNENDFHYIAELLRNYEDEDDLRRVAELIRANKSPVPPSRGAKLKKKQAKKVAKKAAKKSSKRTDLATKSKKKKKKDKKALMQANKKPKYEPPPPSDGEIRANDDYDDDDDSSSSSSSSESSSSSSSSSSESSSSSDDVLEMMAGDEHSSLSSSIRKVKKPKKTKKETKKERKRRRKEKERQKLSKKARKEQDKEKERRKADKKKRSLGEEDSAIVPPTSIKIFQTLRKAKKDHSDASIGANESYTQPSISEMGQTGNKTPLSRSQASARKAKTPKTQRDDSSSNTPQANDDDDYVNNSDQTGFKTPPPQTRKAPKAKPDDSSSSTPKANDDDDSDSGDGPDEVEMFQDEPSPTSRNSSKQGGGSTSSDSDDRPIEVFMNEEEASQASPAPPTSAGGGELVERFSNEQEGSSHEAAAVGPERFPYPGMIQRNNSLSAKGASATSNAPEPSLAQQGGGLPPEEHGSSFDPAFPIPGFLTTTKSSDASASMEDMTETDYGDAFAQDTSGVSHHGQVTGVPFPPPTDADTPQPPMTLNRVVSGGSSTNQSTLHSGPPDQRLSHSNQDNTSMKLSSLVGNSRVSSTTLGKSSNEHSFQDSWQQAESTVQDAASTGRPPTLPTIYSSVTGPPPALHMDPIREFQEGLSEPNKDSQSESSGGTMDEEMVDMYLKQLSNPSNLADADESSGGNVEEGPRISSAYPPMGTAFNRQVSTDYAQQSAPLPTSKLNASLILNRPASSDLLKKTMNMQRQRSGDSLMGTSPSIIRPPSRQAGSGIVSTTDIAKLRETMSRASSSDFMLSRPSSGALVSSDFTSRYSSLMDHGLLEPTEEAPHNTINIRQASNPDDVTGEMIQAEFSVKPRLLCLHGWRSNAEITRLQLDNLGLLDFFDPIFIEGPHISSKPADDAVNLLSQGPYYSWVENISQDSETDTDGGKDPGNRHHSVKSLRKSIYSFGRSNNSGAKRHHAQSSTDELMLSLKAVMMHLITESQYLDAFVHENEEIANIPCYDAVYGFSQGATLVTLLSYEFVRNRVLEELNLPPMQRMPWRFVISACAANTNMKELLADHFELKYSVQIPIPSIHIIGLSDSRKGQSEAIMKDHYNSQQVFPIYLDSGHGIPASTRNLSYVLDEIINWFLLKITLPDVDIANVPLEAQAQGVSMLHIMDEIDKIQLDQLEDDPSAEADLDVGQLHLGAYGQYIINTVQSSHSNLIEMLEDADSKKIAFLAPDAQPLTYGSFLKFIRDEGDLRRAGAQEGFTVAYVAPFGVVSATAFVTIASQCPAAPLDPGYNEADYLLAFEQLKPDLVITFDGVDSGLVHKAALGQGIRVAHASVQPGTCGLFWFDKDKNGSIANLSSFLDDGKRLVNHADNNGLILRTSGTTSKPKVVPLKLWAIVANSRVIAKNLGLRSSDIALNAMPLFHIGGLSANLLSSLAAGGSVILMPKFNAADFFDFLTSPEEPRPTWYSAVPTMHAAIHQFSEDSIFKTSLRFIRSGAAAMPHDLAVKMEKTFDCPLILTYSMTEQMPISQPPRGYSIARNKPNSVGQPVCASMCIVDKNMRPVSFLVDEEAEDGEKEPVNGEVCISGPMIVEGYVANPNANATSFFRMGGMDWFRTGDMGHLDKEGFLFLTGRSKELIKRGGDQVSPYEVEDAIYKHIDVKTVVVFAIPDPIWGERVGAAVILKEGVFHQPLDFKKELNKMLVDDGVQPFKVPEEVMLVKEEDLPKTRSNKYIRIGLAKALGLNSKKERDELNTMRPVHYHEAAVGVKFFLAYAVTYVHIGNFDNRDMDEYSHDADYHYQWEQTRSWCWHNPIFFLVGGFLLAAGTHVPVTTLKDLGNFYSLRIAGLHPMYLISIFFCTINFVARCNPSNYIPDFDRMREPLPGEYFVCQATPIEWSYWPTLIVSVLSYACTLQSWPVMIPFSWFLSYYTWFSSVYIFCIFIFPWCHQQYHAVRDDIDKIWKLTFFWLGMNYLYVIGISVLFAMDNDALKNYFAVSSYLFPPGWFPCCACGVGCYYLFRHYRPNERANSWVWGAITDAISIMLLAGWLFYGLAPEAARPDFTEDDKTFARHWAPFLSRILAPFGFLWFWGLAVGTGYTSSLFSIPFVVEWLAPASYNMFLFHQPVAEWYYLATRGEWWAYPKSFFWFSPHPYPVQFWEFFIVTAIVVAFSVFMEAYFNEFLVANFAAVISWFGGGGLERKSKEGESVFQVVESIILELTYFDVTLETGLTEAGLSSMTTIILVSEIKKVYKTLKLTVRDVINSETVGELVELIESRMKESAARPELALGKRTAVVASKTMKKILGESTASSLGQDYSSAVSPATRNQNSSSSGTLSRERSRLLPKGVSTRMNISNLSMEGSGYGDHQPVRRGRRKSKRASFVLDSSQKSHSAAGSSGNSRPNVGSIRITTSAIPPRLTRTATGGSRASTASSLRQTRMSAALQGAAAASNTPLRANTGLPRAQSRPSNRSSTSTISSRSLIARRPANASTSSGRHSTRSSARPKRMSRMVNP